MVGIDYINTNQIRSHISCFRIDSPSELREHRNEGSPETETNDHKRDFIDKRQPG